MNEAFENDLPEDLVKLEEECLFIRTNPEHVQNFWLTGKLMRGILQYDDSKDPKILGSLSRSQLYFAECVFNRYEHPKLYYSTLDKTIQFITEKNQTYHLVQNHDTAQLLASLCITRTQYVNTIPKPHPKEHNVGDVLSQWCGQSVDEKHWGSLDAIVDYLYGPLVLDLYRNDVHDDYLGRYLWEQGVPLRGELRLDNTTKSGQVLPESLDFGG